MSYTVTDGCLQEPAATRLCWHELLIPWVVLVLQYQMYASDCGDKARHLKGNATPQKTSAAHDEIIVQSREHPIV